MKIKFKLIFLSQMAPIKLIRLSIMFKTGYMGYLEVFNKKVSHVGQCHMWDIFL